MVILALFTGLYSYLIFFLGLLGLLTSENISFLTLIWLLVLLVFEKRNLITFFDWVSSRKFSFTRVLVKKNKLFVVLMGLIVLQAFVNLIGVFGPELAFDALWYHLALPKLYLLQHSVFHIPGGLLYYSDMPKLGEMLYTGALAIGNEITAKLLHFFFGILICIALYNVARKFFSPLVSLLAVVIFYSNLVVAWESTTAYIDLIRTFFETMALWSLFNWFEAAKKKWLITSAVMIGFAITTKLLAIGTGLILSLLIIIHSIDSRLHGNNKQSFWNLFISLFVYWVIALFIPFPWFIFSYVHTGNPVFPFFTHTYEVAPEPVSFFGFFKELWILLTHASDPISPIYLISFPLVFVTWKKLKKEMKYMVAFSGLAIIVWYFTPRTGGGRFILPYLPAFSLICAALYSEILKKTRREWKWIQYCLLGSIIFVSCVSIAYRGVANAKYLPVVFGKESKQTFLTQHLNFSFGDFYDTDKYFAEHINSNDLVLLYGFHNLYYVDFPFVDSSWVQKGNTFNYVAVQNGKVPPRFRDWQLVYKNDKTLVKLYQPPPGMCTPHCIY